MGAKVRACRCSIRSPSKRRARSSAVFGIQMRNGTGDHQICPGFCPYCGVGVRNMTDYRKAPLETAEPFCYHQMITRWDRWGSFLSGDWTID